MTSVHRLMQGEAPTRDARKLRGALSDLARITGSAELAAAEFQHLMDARQADGPRTDARVDTEALRRYVDLARAADGVDLPAIRETFELLEASQDPKLRPAYARLLKACGRQARRALEEYRWLKDPKPEAVARLADLWTGAVDREEVHRSFLGTARAKEPPHLARARATVAKLTGSDDAAREELRFVADHATEDRAVDRYVRLLKAADGVELPAVRKAWEHLEKAKDPALTGAFLELVEASGSAAGALEDLTRVEGTHAAGPGRVREVRKLAEQAANTSGRPVPPQSADPSLRRLEKLLGSRDAAAAELDEVAKVAGPDAAPRFVRLMEAADGLDAPAMREAFQHLEATPEAREGFLALLEQVPPAVALQRLKTFENLKGLEQAAALKLHARAAELTGDPGDALFAAVEDLRALPRAAEAVERLPDLLKLRVPPEEAARDLAALHAALPPDGKADRAMEVLLDLRREADPDSHEGVREALGFLLQAAPAQAETLRDLVRTTEGDPARALDDLRWLASQERDAGAARTYAQLAPEADAEGRKALREALDDLARTPAPAAPRRRFMDWLTGGPLSRQEAFRHLYERESGRAAEALQDLKALEREGLPLEDGLKEMEGLFRLAEARPGSVRPAWLLLRKALPEEREGLRRELHAWARELGDLDLSRRTVAVFRRAVDPNDRRERGQVLERWREKMQASDAVHLFEAADEARAPGQSLKESAELAEALLEERSPGLAVAVLKGAAEDARRPGSPFASRREALDHFVALYRVARDVHDIESLRGFLREAGDFHERSQIVAGLVRGLGNVTVGLDEFRFLEEGGDFQAVASAYSGLVHTLGTRWSAGRSAPDVRSSARELLAWAREESAAGRLGRATVAEILTMLSGQLLMSETLDSARAAVAERFLPARQVDVEEEFVTIGGVQVPRRQGGSA